MPVFERRDYQDPLPGVPISMTHLVIEQIAGVAPRRAEGHFTFADHAEGSCGQYRWVASVGVDGEWGIVPRDEDRFFESPDGKPMFTASSAIDRKIIAYVVGKIKSYLLNPSVTLETPPVYEGPSVMHTGQCLCHEIHRGGKQLPLAPPPFPQRCFLCSCGRGWWNHDITGRLWAPVNDMMTWHSLLHFNGEEVQAVVVTPEHGVILVQRMNEMGFALFV